MIDSGKLPGPQLKLYVTNVATGEVLGSFDTIYDASKYLKINTGSIKLITDGKRKTATSKQDGNKYTFHWGKDDNVTSRPVSEKERQRVISLIFDKTRTNAAKYADLLEDEYPL